MRGGLSVVTITFGLFAAGCVSPEVASADLAAGEAAGDDAARVAPSPQPAAAPSAPAPKGASSTETAAPLVAAKTFEWRSNATFGDLVIGGRIVPTEKTECEISIAMAMIDSPAGTHFFAAMFHEGELYGMGTAGGGSFASAHVAEITTESVVPGGGNSASRVGFGMDVPATGVEFAAGGIAVAAWENELAEGGLVLVNVTCGSPITVLDLAGSHEIALYSLGRSEQGVGAAAFIAGSAGVMDGVALDATSSRVLAAGFGLGIGQMRVTSPDDEITAATDPTSPARVFLEGSAGAWWIGVDAMAAPLFGAWGGVLGLDPVAAWDDLA